GWPHAWRTGACRDPAAESKHRAILHLVCGRVVPGRAIVDLCVAGNRHHWAAGPPGRPTRSGLGAVVPDLIVSDLHGNLEALEAVLADARGRFDRILCLGDLVGYGADPNAIVEWARKNADVVIRGNHDKDCCGDDSVDHYRPLAIASVMWTRSHL